MYSFIVCATTGGGKTFLTRKEILLKAKNWLAMDIYFDEYSPQAFKEHHGVDLDIYTIFDLNDYKGGKARLCWDRKRFATTNELVKDTFGKIDKLKNTTFVIEDATRYITPNRLDYIIDRLVDKRHPNVSYVWLFHSLNRVPLYVLENSSIIAIGRTEDNFKKIDLKFENEKITDAFLKVKNTPVSEKKRPFEFVQLGMIMEGGKK